MNSDEFNALLWARPYLQDLRFHLVEVPDDTSWVTEQLNKIFERNEERKMEKFKIKFKTHSFDHEGMIFEGHSTSVEGKNQIVIAKAKDIISNNIDTMSKNDICSCLAGGREYKWTYSLDALEYLMKPIIPLTILEYELLKYYLKKEYKYITRDKDGELFIYKNKPYKLDIEWNNDFFEGFKEIQFKDLFSFIKWENDEASTIEDILNNCEVTLNE